MREASLAFAIAGAAVESKRPILPEAARTSPCRVLSATVTLTPRGGVQSWSAAQTAGGALGGGQRRRKVARGDLHASPGLCCSLLPGK